MIIVPGNVKPSTDPILETVSLLNGNGANNSTTFTDSAASPVGWTRNGSLVISTAQSKFGGASIFSNANGSLSATTPSRLVLGTTGWTFETWIRFGAIGTGRYCILDLDPSGAGVMRVELQNNAFRYYISTTVGNQVITSSTIANNTWYHFALCKADNVTRMFLDGVQTGGSYADTRDYGTITSARLFTFIGYETDNTFNPIAYMDDIRFSKGYRYDTTFSPPTGQLGT